LIIGSHNISTALSNSDISRTLEAYDSVFDLISKGLENENLETVLKVDPLQPLFRIR
jgi:hypothetical protein